VLLVYESKRVFCKGINADIAVKKKEAMDGRATL
jgi:hypothetical protein